MHITITNKTGNVYPTGKGFASTAMPSEILMHEIAGHAAPRMVGKQGNAIEIENNIRKEIQGKVSGQIVNFQFLLRMPSYHPSIP